MFILPTVPLVTGSLYFVVNIVRDRLYCEGDLMNKLILFSLLITLYFLRTFLKAWKKLRIDMSILVTVNFTFRPRILDIFVNQNPEPRIQDPIPMTRDPGYRTYAPEPRTQESMINCIRNIFLACIRSTFVVVRDFPVEFIELWIKRVKVIYIWRISQIRTLSL